MTPFSEPSFSILLLVQTQGNQKMYFELSGLWQSKLRNVQTQELFDLEFGQSGVFIKFYKSQLPDETSLTFFTSFCHQT